MKSSALIPIASTLLSTAFLFSSFDLSASTAAAAAAQVEETATVYIVFVEEPMSEDPEDFHVRILAAVLGCEEAAERAILFHYTHAASGFAAKLTPKQVEELKKQPGVIQVVPSRAYSIHDPPIGVRVNVF